MAEEDSKSELNIRFDYNLDLHINKLKSMVTKTEEFYGQISERLPDIESEIDNTIEETELLISYFTRNNKADKEIVEDLQMIKMIKDLKEKINRVYKIFADQEDVSEILAGFIQGSNQEEAKFLQIIALIDELNELLTDLENLSINSIIFSVSAGKKGAGFRVVSNEINNLSNKIQDRYELIKESILTLQDWHSDFTSNLHKLMNIEDEIVREYKKEVGNLFSVVLDSLQVTADNLNQFINQVNRAVEPIPQIIVLLQKQDIIRQKIENLIDIFVTLQDEIDILDLTRSKTSEILNKLVFIIDVASLAKKLMENILLQLDESLFEIQDKFQQMKIDLEELEDESELLQGDMDLSYQQLIDYLPDLTNQLIELDVKYEYLINNQSLFYSNLEEITDHFTQITPIANRFKKVKLLAKIEFARLDKKDKSFIQDIAEAIDDFVKFSSQNQELYNSLKEEMLIDYQEFINLVQKSQKDIKKSSQWIKESEKDLLRAKDRIKEANQALHHSVNTLVEEIINVNQAAKEVSNLEEIGRDVIDFLVKLEDKAEELKGHYLSQVDNDSWEESNQRLQEIEEKFTSYLERKTAQEEINDLEIDVGSEGGELTLF
ncbi:hypothetical protein JCM16358_04340 [Halanaerocella petrolearia]